MKVRDWRSPEHGFAADNEVEPEPGFATDDPWYPAGDEATAQRVLHDPEAFRAEWAAEDAWDEQPDQLAAELHRHRVLAAFSDL